MFSMSRSKNRNKKADRQKKSRAKPKEQSGSPVSNPEPLLEHMDPAAMNQVECEEPGSGGGTMIGIRKLINGAQPVKEGFFSRRRTLGEWSLWFGGAIALYYAIQHFLGD